MNQAAKQKWVAALRSGEFKQGRGRLERYDGTLCCLGVACVVAEREGVSVRRSTTGRLDGATLREGIECHQPAVMEWLGISERVETKLIARNDLRSHSFEQIADYIQRHVR